MVTDCGSARRRRAGLLSRLRRAGTSRAARSTRTLGVILIHAVFDSTMPSQLAVPQWPRTRLPAMRLCRLW